MVDQTRALVEKQVHRVWRRLFFQVVIESVVLCVGIGFLSAMAWFLVRPFAFLESGDTVRWMVPGVLLGLSTITGLVLAWVRRPNLVASSLALDERFGLKERVTTFLTLPADQLDTPVGAALLKDVTTQLATLKVTTKFPLRIPAQRLWMPAGAFILALAACLLDPMLGDLKFSSQTNAETPRRVSENKEMQQKLDELKKIINEREKEQQLKSEDLKKLEEEFQKLVNQPLDPKNEEKVRERINKFRDLQERMKDRAEALADKQEKIDRLKEQLGKLNLDKKDAAKDGPAKDFEDALRKGDLDKAKAALEKMVKDLKNGKLDEKQKKQLAEQFKKLQNEMKKVMNEDQFMKKLKQDLKDGKIKQEDLEREMMNFKHLEDLGKLLGDAKDAMEMGKGKEANEKLDKLIKAFEEMQLTDMEAGDLLRDQAEIEAALNLFRDALDDADNPDAQGGGNPGRRRRADPNDPNSKIRDERSRAKADAKAPQRVVGYSRGGTFSKIPAQGVDGAFKQAAQDAPEALDRQRIPDDAAAITRGYFNRLGNQK